MDLGARQTWVWLHPPGSSTYHLCVSYLAIWTLFLHQKMEKTATTWLSNMLLLLISIPFLFFPFLITVPGVAFCMQVNIRHHPFNIHWILHTENCNWSWGDDPKNNSLQFACILHHWGTWLLMACDTWHYVTQHQGQNRLKLVLFGEIQNFEEGLQLIKFEWGFHLLPVICG